MVGEKLREVRLSQRLSLTQVAGKAGISAATLSRIETNKQNVDVALFLLLARILKVTPHELFGGDGHTTDEEDPLVRRIGMLAAPQRTKMWRELAAQRRADRSGRHAALRTLGQQVEELVAQIDFLREEVEAVRSRIRRRK